jgi:uncharacterized protein YbbC (DUF1343 family)
MMRTHYNASMRIALGSERLLDTTTLDGTTVGIVCNPASVDHDFRHIVDRLTMRAKTRVGAIFGPQHGFHSDVQENMIETGHASDAERKVPIYSLYSDTRKPTPEMLRGLDVLVIDLQDVGTRIYTYIYTMAYCLVAAREQGLKVIVCDRPNPIGGVAVEGPMLARGFESFVGLYPIPMRHGMTIGELARLFNDHFGIGADLDVVPMSGWQREMYHDTSGAPWVMPSPNMPTLDSAIVYPGTVLFEGTNVSEGRGTTRPFELIGAPWVMADRFAAALNRRNAPGVVFRPTVFEPTFHKHAKTSCGGCQLHVTDRQTFKPVLSAVLLTEAFLDAGPDAFGWREPPYEYEYEKLPFDILAGTDETRRQLERGMKAEAIAQSWEASVEEFQKVRTDFLLY